MNYVDIHSHHEFPDGVVGIRNLRFPEVTPSCDFSVGIHPWDADKYSFCPEFLALASNAVAIGECGLDKCCDVPMHTQLDIFQMHIQISLQLNKPMIIHCVQAYGKILELSKLFSPHTPWLIHGCYASTEWIKQASEDNFFFSVGPAQIKMKRFNDVIKAIPSNKLLLETDDSPQNITDVYNALNIPREAIYNNYIRFLNVSV